MGIRITGLDEFRRKLERLSRNAQNVSGPVAFDDLFPPEFMRRVYRFPDNSSNGGRLGIQD